MSIVDELKEKEIDLSLPQIEVLNSFVQRCLFMAGVGSGKSYVAAPIIINFARNYPNLRGFIGANTYNQLSKSTLSRIFDVWEEVFGLKRDVDYVVDRIPPAHFQKYGARLKSYSNTISFKNGHLIFLASLDNYSTIDGTEFAYAILDETKDTKEAAVKEVITARLRQPGMYVSDGGLYNQDDFEKYLDEGIFEWREKENEKGETETICWNTVSDALVDGYNPLFVFTSPAKVDWINDWFGITPRIKEIMGKIFSKTDYYHSKHSNCAVTICSTYHNERNLSLGYIQNKIEDYAHNQQLIDMLIYGCPVAKSGGEWWHKFDRMKHVKKLELDPAYPVHLSIDENVTPYMTLTVHQYIPVDNKIHWRILKEFCLPNPKNNAESLAEEFLFEYAGEVQDVYYTGDATSQKRSTLRKGNEHIYDVIDEILADILNPDSRQVPTSNPSLAKCRTFFNRILHGYYDYIIFEVDETCVNCIADFEFLKEDPKGGYKKQRVKDDITGETYEKYGHCADTVRYAGVTAFPDEWAE